MIWDEYLVTPASMHHPPPALFIFYSFLFIFFFLFICSDIDQNEGILFVMIWDEDLVTPDSMGQVVFPLTSLKPREKLDVWLPVLPKKPHEKIKGEIRLILNYDYTKVC